MFQGQGQGHVVPAASSIYCRGSVTEGTDDNGGNMLHNADSAHSALSVKVFVM